MKLPETVDTKRDEAKLRELMLYIATRCESDPNFGSTKLNKVLFWADMTHYGRTGETITGAEYQKLPFGPALRRMLPVLDDLKESESAMQQERDTMRGKQKRLIALRSPNFNVFTAAEIAVVNEILEVLCGQSASQMSDATHELPAWRFARHGETINPNAIFLSNEPISESEAAMGWQAAQEQGLA